MVTEFIEGEVYTNKKLDYDVMVYAVASKTADEVVLAIGKINRESEEMFAPGELTVKTSEFSDWELVEL